MIRTGSPVGQVASISLAGGKNKPNQDRFGVSSFRYSLLNPTPVTLAVIADGIGGKSNGDQAAEIAVQVITKEINKDTLSNPVLSLKKAMTSASQAIHRRSQELKASKGMGTTAACVCVVGNFLYIANCGNSRIYLSSKNTFQQISHDHSWVHQALESGVLTADQIANHPNAHIITRYLGSPERDQIDTRLRLNSKENDFQQRNNQGTMLAAGTLVFICTDGITGWVSDNEIKAILSSYPPEEALHTVAETARKKGSRDDLTAVLINLTSQNGLNQVWYWPAWMWGASLITFTLLAILIWQFFIMLR